MSADELAIVGRAAIYLEREQEANRLFQQATRSEPANWTLFIPWGELLLEKYNTADACSVFADALKANKRAAPALLWLARCTAEQDLSAAIGLVHEASGINPHAPAAMALLGELLLAAGDEKSAATHIDRLRREHPRYVPGMALAAMLADRNHDLIKRDQLCREASASNPYNAEVYLRLGEDSARRYLFREAVAHYRRALEIDAGNWQAVAGLGISLSRLGDEKSARQHLERAFTHDPFNVLVGNMLNLFDDFAVRCFGLPGAQFFLGICFGPLIAMNSPRAREKGSFNWQETLWHEIAHVLHLQLTDNRLPRWLAEGMAVYEAARAQPAWDMNLELAMAQAIQNGKALPLRDLDGGFTQNPQSAMLAYYQSSQIVWFIEQQYGFQRVLDLLPHFRRGAKTAEAVTAVFSLSIDEFDAEFQKFLNGTSRRRTINARLRRWIWRLASSPTKPTATAGAA